MKQQTHRWTMDDTRPDSILGLDVFSSDGQPVGRIGGYVEEVADERAGIERDTIDVIDRDGHLEHPARVLIDGHGFPTQVQMALPETLLDVDLRGRRVTIPLTLAQIRDSPHRIPSEQDAPPLNVQ